MMIGHLVLSWPTAPGLYLGLGFLILGNGAFKPNIGVMVGGLYPPGSKLRDAGYSIFYMGVNLGAFICNFVAAIVRNYFDAHPWQITENWQLGGWHAAFGVAAIGMFIGLILFSLNYHRFAHVDQRVIADKRSNDFTPLFLECLIPAALFAGLFYWFGSMKWLPFPAVTAAFLGACLPVMFFYFRIWSKLQNRDEKNRTSALLVLFLIVIIFWSVFHLNTTALTIWARDNTDRTPNKMVSVLTDRIEGYTENADSKYYTNASPETPRPAKDSFAVIAEQEYKQKEKNGELLIKDDQSIFVTQKRLDEVFARANETTPVLEKGKHLKVINTELFQSINPAYVIMFTPLVVGFFHWLRSRGWEPSTPAKIAMGLFVTGLGPMVMFAATYYSNDGAMKVTAWWLFGTYAVATVGELCLSPIGLSFVNKVSPKHIGAFMLGGWYMSTAIGNKLSGIFGELYSSPEVNHYYFWIALTVGASLAAGSIFVLLPWFKKSLASS
jgi:POT family proton-dependent oligopeptide transporter